MPHDGLFKGLAHVLGGSFDVGEQLTDVSLGADFASCFIALAHSKTTSIIIEHSMQFTSQNINLGIGIKVRRARSLTGSSHLDSITAFLPTFTLAAPLSGAPFLDSFIWVLL